MNEVLNFNKITDELIKNKEPSKYFEDMFLKGNLDLEPFDKLKKLKDIPQSQIHHPEGDVWNHTMLVIDNGAYYKKYSNNKKCFMWALLLHDIGKIKTTKLRKGKWTSYNHDNVGAIEAKEFFIKLGVKDNEFIEKVENLIRYHMHFLYISKDLPFGNKEKMVKEVDLNDISLVFLCDRLGRGGLNKEDKENVVKDIEGFMEKYNININW